MKVLKFFLILLLLPQVAFATNKMHLVAVGIADYPGSANDLSLPAKDAETMEDLFMKNSNATTALLLNSKATRSAIMNAIRTTFKYASTDDIIVFFFSGHGYKGGFMAYDGALSYDDVRSAMNESRCKNKMIFADACYSGKMRQGSRPVTVQHKRSNVMLFLSSRDNETSIERRDMTNGFFTTALVAALRGKADINRDRTITAKELFNYVSYNVKKLSNNRQHPVMWGHFADDMPVFVW